MTGSLAPSLRKLVKGGWSLDERGAVASAFQSMMKLPVSTAGMVANGTDAGGYDRLLFSVKDPTSARSPALAPRRCGSPAPPA